MPFILLGLPLIPDLYRSCIYIAVRTNYSKYAYSVCIFVQAGALNVYEKFYSNVKLFNYFQFSETLYTFTRYNNNTTLTAEIHS